MDIELVRLDSNYGFSKAVNEGIIRADSEYVILLNNDTKADKNFVCHLEERIAQEENIFSVGAKMMSLHQPEIVDDAGDYYCAFGWAYALGKGKKDSKAYSSTRKIFAACAGAAIYRKEIFEKIGYFDENHFAYLEDIDVGYRAKIYGYYNVFAIRNLLPLRRVHRTAYPSECQTLK